MKCNVARVRHPDPDLTHAPPSHYSLLGRTRSVSPSRHRTARLAHGDPPQRRHDHVVPHRQPFRGQPRRGSGVPAHHRSAVARKCTVCTSQRASHEPRHARARCTAHRRHRGPQLIRCAERAIQAPPAAGVLSKRHPIDADEPWPRRPGAIGGIVELRAREWRDEVKLNGVDMLRHLRAQAARRHECCRERPSALAARGGGNRIPGVARQDRGGRVERNHRHQGIAVRQRTRACHRIRWTPHRA